MLTISSLLLLSAFITAIMSAINKCPLWVSVILLIVHALVSSGGIN